MFIKSAMHRPRVITTIHIDETTTLSEIYRAANLVLEVTEAIRIDDRAADGLRDKLVEEWRANVLTLTEPMEIRVGSQSAEPIVVIHPRTRAAGIAAKAKAKAEGRWQTRTLIPGEPNKPI